MKSIMAVVRPHIVDRLLNEITSLNLIDSGSITAVKGYGRQKNYLNEYHGSEYSMAYLPKVLVKVRAGDEHIDQIIATIIKVARTGRMGDGKIFILDTLSGDEASTSTFLDEKDDVR